MGCTWCTPSRRCAPAPPPTPMRPPRRPSCRKRHGRPSSATPSRASPPPTPPKPSANGSRPPIPGPGPSAPPPPTPPPPHREGEGHGQGEGEGQQGTLRQGGTEGQAPIGTGHRNRHSAGAVNHPRAGKGEGRGPRHRGREHHGRATSAAPPPANAPRLPETHTPITRRRSKTRTPYGSHQPTPTSRRKPHRGWRTRLHGENRLHPPRKLRETPPPGAPPHPHHQATAPAATRATSQAPAEEEGTATETGARDRDLQRARDPRVGNPTDT